MTLNRRDAQNVTPQQRWVLCCRDKSNVGFVSTWVDGPTLCQRRRLKKSLVIQLHGQGRQTHDTGGMVLLHPAVFSNFRQTKHDWRLSMSLYRAVDDAWSAE